VRDALNLLFLSSFRRGNSEEGGFVLRNCFLAPETSLTHCLLSAAPCQIYLISTDDLKDINYKE
jgi:hypothetical protein